METSAMISELLNTLDELSYAAYKDEWDALAYAIGIEQQDKDVRENGHA